MLHPPWRKIDGDPQAEVIAGAYDLVALDGLSGALEWRAENGSRVWPGIALADLTGNGTLEIIVGRSGDQLSVYNLAGARAVDTQPLRQRRGALAGGGRPGK